MQQHTSHLPSYLWAELLHLWLLGGEDFLLSSRWQ